MNQWFEPTQLAGLNPLEFPRHYTCGGVYVKEIFMEHVGSRVLSHKHKYDHLSVLAAGSVAVTVDGVQRVYHGRTALVIQAGKEHTIEALVVPVIWYCIHSVPEDLQGEAMLDSAVTEEGYSRVLRDCNTGKKLDSQSLEPGDGW